jgi:hypothetical protein
MAIFPNISGKNALVGGYILPYNLWQKVPSVCPKLPCPLGTIVVIITFKMGIFSLLKAVLGGEYTIYMAIISLDSDFISIENDYIDSMTHIYIHEKCENTHVQPTALENAGRFQRNTIQYI